MYWFAISLQLLVSQELTNQFSWGFLPNVALWMPNTIENKNCICETSDFVCMTASHMFSWWSPQKSDFKWEYLTLTPKGVATTPQTVYVPVLKNAQPKGKIALGTFKFILSPHFSKKKKLNLPPSPEVGGSWCDPVVENWIVLKIFKVICTPNFVCKLESPFSNIFSKKPHENVFFYDLLGINQFLPTFYTQTDHF